MSRWLTGWSLCARMGPRRQGSHTQAVPQKVREIAVASDDLREKEIDIAVPHPHPRDEPA